VGSEVREIKMRRADDWIYGQYVKELVVKRELEYYLDEKGNFVFTEHYLKKMKHCCGNGCKHCPFEPRHIKGNNKLGDIY
jgi:hypothetical protein